MDALASRYGKMPHEVLALGPLEISVAFKVLSIAKEEEKRQIHEQSL